MKKYLIYLGILVVGLFLGKQIFGSGSNKDAEHTHEVVSESNQRWTCSMHPQILQSEPGDCPICGMDMVPAGLSEDGLSPDQIKLTQNAMALANIETYSVGQGEESGASIKLSGKIAENEESNVVQVSYFSGRIEDLNVRFTGEKVQKGQLLATIYSPELYAAQQELISAASLKESQPALYKAVRNKLKLWKLSEDQINQIEETGEVKENFPVYSTVSGTVSEKLIEQGESVKQGQALLKISNLNTVWANFDVYENQIDLFKKGQDIQITTNAYSNKKFEATVDFIDPVLDSRTRTVKLRAVLINTEGIFKPGMFVEARIRGLSSNEEQAFTVPSSAVLWTGERSLVYLKTDPDQPVFEMREVTLGNEAGGNYQVLEGLDIGDEIVVNGTFTVDAAAQIQGKKSMMNKKGNRLKTGHEGHTRAEHSASEDLTNQTQSTERLIASTSFQNQLKLVFSDYIRLKDALVNNNSKKAAEGAKALLNSLSKVNMELLTDKISHNQWMKLEAEIKSSASSISNSDDIEKERVHFKQLSSDLAKAIQLFGINETVYYQYCPMVDNNIGAYWLSKEEKVFNPYFGEAMLSCGELKQVFN